MPGQVKARRTNGHTRGTRANLLQPHANGSRRNPVHVYGSHAPGPQGSTVMNSGHAPRLAQALLRRFVKAGYAESLEGDLLEELAAGRTKLWYWRQVAFALYEQGQCMARTQ